MTHAPFDSLSRTLGEHLRQVQAFWLRLVLLVALLALTVSWAGGAHAAPRAQSADECFLITDMGVTARALAEEGLALEAAVRVLARMYPEKMAAKWALAIAARAQTDRRTAKEFAARLYEHCTTNTGNVDGFLGVAL